MAVEIWKPQAATGDLKLVCFIALILYFLFQLLTGSFSSHAFFKPCFLFIVSVPIPVLFRFSVSLLFSDLQPPKLFLSRSRYHGRVLRHSCFCLTHWAVHRFSPTIQDDQPPRSVSVTRSSFPVSGARLTPFKRAWWELCRMRTSGSRGRNADEPWMRVLHREEKQTDPEECR